MERILENITEAIEKRGLTDAFVSREAVGNPSVIKNLKLRRGKTRNHPIENLLAVAEYLGLEVYIGPPRDPRPHLKVDIGNEDFIAVPRYDVQASAGPGAMTEEQSPVGALAFRRDWLQSQSLSPSELFVIEVAGPSMEPDLTSGDLVLVDKTRRMVGIKGREVYAFVDTDGSLRIKRLERLDTGLVLHSDNPDFQTEMRDAADAARIVIVGKVVWSGHSWTAK